MEKKLTEAEVLDLYMQNVVDNPLDAAVEPEDLIRIFEEMSKIDGVQKMLSNMLGKNMKIHYAAKADTERSNIEGHSRCLLYMKAMMRNIEEKKEALLLGKSRAQ